MRATLNGISNFLKIALGHGQFLPLCRSLLAILFAVGLTACAQNNPEGYVPSATEQALTGSTFEGEWRSGYLYEVTFSGVGQEMTARVHVIDSDADETEFHMPARVVVNGQNVTLNFTKFNRVDHLTLDPDGNRLSGYTVFEGEEQNKFLWAEKV